MSANKPPSRPSEPPPPPPTPKEVPLTLVEPSNTVERASVPAKEAPMVFSHDSKSKKKR